jgi:hypothetical protein
MATSSNTPFVDLLTLLRRLEAKKIHYRLSKFREDAIAVEVAVPGERWEIEYLADGSIEVERFESDGTIGNRQLLEELTSRFSD